MDCVANVFSYSCGLQSTIKSAQAMVGPNESCGIIEKPSAELSKLHAKCSTTFYSSCPFMRNVEAALGPL